MSETTEIKKNATGVEGLDVLLSGGLPKNRTILIVGGPGSGKSVLSTQFLVQGIEKDNENAIYVSLDYRKNAFLNDMKNFGWDFEKYEKEGKFLFLEGSAIKRMPSTSESDDTYSPDELTLDDLVDLLKLHIDKINAKRVVIDSLTALTFTFPNETQRRSGVLSIMESLAGWDVSTIVITEASIYDLQREITIEEYLSEGVIGMYVLKDGTRAIQIAKMRGLKVDNKPRPYNIIDKVGIEVYPSETIFGED